jgi:hypothetical protein
MYPLLLELTVETCFPVDESIPVALIAISTALQSVVLMELDSVLAKPIFTFPKNGTSQMTNDSINESPLHYNVSAFK